MAKVRDEEHKTLRLPGQGGWKREAPLLFEVVPPIKNPYLWIGAGPKDAESFVAALSPAEARKLGRFLRDTFGD
jgi:hypothetical protein